MSEPIVPAAPVEAPVAAESNDSIESVIETAVADHPDREASAEPSAASTAQTVQPGQQPPTQNEFDALIDAEMGPGYTQRRDNRVPHSRTVKIIENAKKKWAEEQAAALKQHTEKLTAYEQEREHFAAVEQMIQADPETFVRNLVALNPAYRQFFAGGGQGTATPNANVTNADGTVNLEAFAAQIVQQTEERISQRYAPIEQEHKVRAIYTAALPKVQAQIEDAKSWPMFEEHKGEILAALQADPKIDLRGAYQKAVFPKLAANRDAMRAEILAEMNRRPHSTSTVPSTAQRVADEQPQDLEDVIRQSIRSK